MHFTLFTIATVAALLSSTPLINAHVGLSNPGTYLTSDNLPPLAPDGSDYPCSVPTFDNVVQGEVPILTPGGTASINLFGTAVHGGGSCQISITYDSPPRKTSIWKVLKSYEGGCPIQAEGNLPAHGTPDIRDAKLPPLDYTLPKGLSSGQVTIAWTWFNRIGNREMYMRCHKARVSSGAGTSTVSESTNDDSGLNSTTIISTRSAVELEDGSHGLPDTRVFDSLPDMFIANMYSTTCKTIEGQNVLFPTPQDTRGQVGWTGDCVRGSGQSQRRAVRFSKEHMKRRA